MNPFRALGLATGLAMTVALVPSLPVAAAPLPQISVVSPDFGSARGGEIVTITGTGLGGPEDTPDVLLDDVPAGVLSVSEDGTAVTVVTPEHVPGTVSVVVQTSAGTSSDETAFRYYAVVSLDNGALAFGDGTVDSVGEAGTLNPPSYYSPDAQDWFPLTYQGHYPLAFAIGGGTGSNWSGGSVTDMSSDEEGAPSTPLDDMLVDLSGFVVTDEVPLDGDPTYVAAVGYGTVTVSGDTVVDNMAVHVVHSYTLPQTAPYVSVDTTIRNDDASPIDNVTLWVGTQDDWIGETDEPDKIKGNLVDGVFSPIEDETAAAAALEIVSDAEGVLFYSTTPNATSALNDCCDFSHAYEQDPQTSAIESGFNDGSYALVLPVGTLAVGESASLTWFYAAGPIDALADIAAEVAAAAAPAPPAGVPGDGQVALTWTEPESDDPITNYAIRWSDDGGDTWTEAPLRDPSTATEQVVTGLDNGSEYLFEVAAVTGTDPDTVLGDWSSPGAVVIPGSPTAPVLTSADAGDGVAVVAFTESEATHESAPVTNYEYRLDGGDWTELDPADVASPVTITGLDNGETYSIRLRAVSDFGPSQSSNALEVTPEESSVTVPDAPTGLWPTVGDGRVVLHWTAPADDGGSEVTDYQIQYRRDGGTWRTYVEAVLATPRRTVVHLVNGAEYGFRVRAVNEVGAGPFATLEGTVTPVYSGPTAAYTVPAALRVGTAFSLAPSITGSPVRLYVIPGTVPPGLSFDTATGVFSGIPQAQGAYPMSIRTVARDGRTSQTLLTLRVTGGFRAYFGGGSATLDTADRRMVLRVVDTVRGCSTCTVTVKGYAAYVHGGYAQAKAIAQMRAAVVARALRARGVRVAAAQVIAVGYPQARGADLTAQRRAVVTVVR